MSAVAPTACRAPQPRVPVERATWCGTAPALRAAAFDSPLALRVAAFVPATRVEGPGLRAALWVQGCDLGCPGCCNPELFDATAVAPSPVSEWVAALQRARASAAIDGLTVLGGEPLQQLDGVAMLVAAAADLGLSTVVFTGYPWATARAQPGFSRLWAALDTLVAGPFDPRLPEPRAGGRATIGSTNQTLHHRTARLAAAALWHPPRAAELHVLPGPTLRVIGDPRLARRMARALAGARAPAFATATPHVPRARGPACERGDAPRVRPTR